MNIEDLKAAWKQYDIKLQATHTIHDKIISSMIADRTRSRFDGAKRTYKISIVWMTLCLGFSIVVLLTNPFDYRYTLQYAPMIIFAMGLLIMIAALCRTLFQLSTITVMHQTISESLQQIIAVHAKPRRFVHYTVFIFLFSQVILFPLSFLPHTIERMGLGYALVERLIPISIGASLLYVAFRFGAFRDKKVNLFKQDFAELNALKANLHELYEREKA